jgi:osmotically-inducible protein OsmY
MKTVPAVLTLIALAASLALSACVPAMVAAGVGGATLVATDRRSTGAQVDDETIEFKISNLLREQYGERIHVNVTSYNGMVLLTGEVPDVATLASIYNLAKGTEKVKSVQNEAGVGPNATLSTLSNDTFITSKVKTRLLEGQYVPGTLIKVVTERGVVYLMGIVSRTEGDAAGQIASTTTDVTRVVKVFEYRGATS